MYEFIYHVKFRIVNEKLNIKIFLSLDDLFTPVYIRKFDEIVLQSKDGFLPIYEEINEYLTNRQIVINDDDFKFLYETLLFCGIELPNIKSVVTGEYDDELDGYDHILTPKDIVFLNYADKKAVDDKRFKSWEEEYHLHSQYLTQDLLMKDLLTLDDYYFNLTKAKRDDLLDVVELYQLDVRGDNKDLIDKIKKDLDEENVKRHFSGTHYTLSNKGKKVLEKSKKLIEFDRSFYHYINKLPLEEFHLLSIKKSDYDSNGIGRLLMVNSNNNNVEYFDWDLMKKEEINEVVEEDVTNEEITDNENIVDLINKISVSYKDKKDEVSEKEVKEEPDLIYYKKDKVTKNNVKYNNKTANKKTIIYDETEGLDLEDIYIEEDPNIKEKLDAYRKKREMFEQSVNNEVDTQKQDTFDNEIHNDGTSGHRLLKWLAYFLFFIVCSVGILYINERFNIIKMPFTIESIYESFKETINEYRWKVKDFIEYLKDYKSK